MVRSLIIRPIPVLVRSDRAKHSTIQKAEQGGRIFISSYLEDLDMALLVMNQMSRLFDRLDDKAKHNRLQILIYRIIAAPMDG